MKTLTIEEKRSRLVTIREIVRSLTIEARNLRTEIYKADDDARYRGCQLVNELREQMEK